MKAGEILSREVADPGDLLSLHARYPAEFPFLLESAAFGTHHGSYDILFAFPGSELALDRSGHLWRDGVNLGAGDFLETLDADWRALRDTAVRSPLPFSGGWFVFLGYELAQQVEPTLRLHTEPGLPVAFAARVRSAIVRRCADGHTMLVGEPGALTDLDRISERLRRCDAPAVGGQLLQEGLREEPPDGFLRAVERAQRYIIDGDIFQANLSRAWRGRLRVTATDAEIYRRLRASNPGPFAGLAVRGDHAILSSSPERLIRCRDGVVETRPIAGTRPRGTGAEKDRALSRELIGHPKERAEHIMLLDLERNDLGRICRPGTVFVDELMAVESYSHVHHIVSNVRGILRADVTPGAAIRAVFPGGTITGCPKVRCMEIIAELERATRGPYTGSMGYLNLDGSCDFNILIRTLVRSGRDISLRAGGGIVADSVGERELAETRAKARGLLLALANEQSPVA